MNIPRQPDFNVAKTQLETAYGIFNFQCFSWGSHEEDNVLCLSNLVESSSPPICRLQSACYTSEIFRSLDCDCHEQLESSLNHIAADGGLLIYMLCDGRGAGLFTKTLGLELGRTEGLDTSEAYTRLGVPQDPREYSRAAAVLRHNGIGRVRLLTNNPRKIAGLQENGIEVQREALEIVATTNSAPYLRTKAMKMGHLIRQFSAQESD